MDTTADAYLYAGVRMMGEFYRSLDNAFLAAIVQLIGAGVGAWLLSERWQRWRQQREYQHRMMIAFADQSERLFSVLFRLLHEAPRKHAGTMDVNEWNDLMRQAVTLSGSLLGAYPMARVTFADETVAVQMLETRNLVSTVLGMAAAVPPVPRTDFEPVQHEVLSTRDLVLLLMAREMRMDKNRILNRVLEHRAAAGPTANPHGVGRGA